MDPLHVRIKNLHNTNSALEAYQRHYLGTRADTPVDETELRKVLEDLRRESCKSFDTQAIGTVIIREKMAVEAYIGILDVLRDAIVQTSK